jgi:hypothetical protein
MNISRLSDFIRRSKALLFDWDLFRPLAIESDPRWARAIAFKDETLPDPSVEYLWVWEYARDSVDRALKIFERLDDKANEILKYLGGGAGLLTAAALLGIKDDHAWIYLFFAPSLGTSLVAILFAIMASKPNDVRLPPPINEVYALASNAEPYGKAIMIGPLHETHEAIMIAVELKARRVNCATWWFFATLMTLGMTTLAVAIVLIIRRHFCS